MGKMWKQIKENKTKIILFLLITIMAICGFNYYGKYEMEKQMVNAEIKETRVSQTTIPDGYTGIYNAEDLANVNNNLSGKYILMSDIDMTGKNHTIIGQNSSFSGIFDGNFHTISNVKIESANQYVGIFGYVYRGTIKNLTIGNIDVVGTMSSDSQYIGGLIGRSISSTIEGVEVKGSNIKEIGAAYAYIGGLAGYVEAGNIKSSYADTNITGGTGTSYIGGLVGRTYSNGANVIDQAYSKGNITIGTGLTYAGGLLGEVSHSKTNVNLLTNAFSIVNIKGENNNTSTCIGGLIGKINSQLLTYKISIYYTYAVGKIEANTTGAKGGLVGQYNWAGIYGSYWSSEISGVNVSTGGENKVFQEMLYKTTYSWDFDKIWGIDENGGSLPYLKSMEHPSELSKENFNYLKYEGKGTEKEPYIIDSVEKLSITFENVIKKFQN